MLQPEVERPKLGVPEMRSAELYSSQDCLSSKKRGNGERKVKRGRGGRTGLAGKGSREVCGEVRKGEEVARARGVLGRLGLGFRQGGTLMQLLYVNV